jgi:hypothetical protein
LAELRKAEAEGEAVWWLDQHRILLENAEESLAEEECQDLPTVELAYQRFLAGESPDDLGLAYW